MFAEYDSSLGIHRGIDTNKGNGSTIYSITNGQVVAKTNGCICIYYAAFDLTFIYMHLNVSPSLNVDDIVSKWTILGTEYNNGANSYHTHIEIKSGIAYGGQSANYSFPSSPVLSPYSYLRYFC